MMVRLAGGLGLSLGVLAVGGCVHEPDVASRSLIQPGSKIAQAIAEVKATPSAYPKLADIPAMPQDIPSAEDFAAAVASLDASAATLDRTLSTAPRSSPPDPDWAASVLRSSGLEGITPPAESTRAETEALAAELRRRAMPPPPPQ